jgi:alpha-L-arabinofuranosidase
VDEYVTFCRKVGADPLIAINVDPKNPDMIKDALDLLEYCNGAETSEWGKVRAVNGHPLPYKVKYWELGNEVWGMGVDAYVDIIHQLVPALRKADSSVVISVCGSGGLGHEGIGMEWNKVLIEKCADLIDYLSIHFYEGARRFDSGPTNFENFIRETGKYITPSANPKLKIFVSEWNAQTTDWRTGLYCGSVLNTFERNSNIIGMATPALLLRYITAPGWDNAFINFNQNTWFAAPNYVVMKLWHEHFAPNCIELTGDSSKLNIIATKSDDEKRIFVKAVNSTSKVMAINLTINEGFIVGNVGFWLLSPGQTDVRNTFDAPTKITKQRGEVRKNEKVISFTMPAFSAGVVSLKAK